MGWPNPLTPPLRFATELKIIMCCFFLRLKKCHENEYCVFVIYDFKLPLIS